MLFESAMFYKYLDYNFLLETILNDQYFLTVEMFNYIINFIIFN